MATLRGRACVTGGDGIYQSFDERTAIIDCRDRRSLLLGKAHRKIARQGRILEPDEPRYSRSRAKKLSFTRGLLSIPFSATLSLGVECWPPTTLFAAIPYKFDLISL